MSHEALLWLDRIVNDA